MSANGTKVHESKAGIFTGLSGVMQRGSALAALAFLAACVSPQAPPPPSRPPIPVVQPAPPRPAPVDPRTTAPRALEQAIRSLGLNFNGNVGIAVRRVDRDWVIGHNGDALFPQQSVSKLWVGMALLDAVDRGKVTLDDSVTIRRDDLTLFHQPLANMVGKDGYSTTLGDLFDRAMKNSDNTANDALLRTVGGSDAIRSYLARRFIAGIRFGPGERLLQSRAAGLQWNQNMSVGRNFYTARANLPRSVREKALDDYLADPPDGAKPTAIVAALAKLKRGEMLSPASTRRILATMTDAKTGPQRIKGGVPPGWSYGHKTGTGQDLPPRSTGFNDVGIMTAPDGTSYAVAVMIGSTTVSVPQRWELMQAVARAVAATHVK